MWQGDKDIRATNRHARRCMRQHQRGWIRSINYRNLFVRFIGGNLRWQSTGQTSRGRCCRPSNQAIACGCSAARSRGERLGDGRQPCSTGDGS